MINIVFQSLWERVTPEGNDLVVTGNAIVSSLLSICKTLLESKSELFCERGMLSSVESFLLFFLLLCELRLKMFFMENPSGDFA